MSAKQEHRRRKMEHRMSARMPEHHTLLTSKNIATFLALGIAEAVLTACGSEAPPQQYALNLPQFVSEQFQQSITIPAAFSDSIDLVKCPPNIEISNAQLVTANVSYNPITGEMTVNLTPQDGVQGVASIMMEIQAVDSSGSCVTAGSASGSATFDTQEIACTQTGFSGNTIQANCSEDGMFTVEGITSPIVNGQVSAVINDPSHRAVATMKDIAGNTSQIDVAIGANPTVQSGIVYKNDQYSVAVACDTACELSADSIKVGATQQQGEALNVPVKAGDGESTLITAESNGFQTHTTFVAPTLGLEGSPQFMYSGTVKILKGQIILDGFTCVEVAYDADCVVNGVHIPEGQTGSVPLGAARVDMNNQPIQFAVSDPAHRSTTATTQQPIYNPFAYGAHVDAWKGKDLRITITSNDSTQSVETIEVKGHQSTAMSPGSLWQGIEKMVNGSDTTINCNPVAPVAQVNTFNCEVPYGQMGLVNDMSLTMTDKNGYSQTMPLDVYELSAGQIDKPTYPIFAERAYNGFSFLGLIGAALVGLNVVRLRIKDHNEQKAMDRRNSFAHHAIHNLINASHPEIQEILKKHRTLKVYAALVAQEQNADFNSNEWHDMQTLLTITERAHRAREHKDLGGLLDMVQRPDFATIEADFRKKQASQNKKDERNIVYENLSKRVDEVKLWWDGETRNQMQKLEDILAQNGISTQIENDLRVAHVRKELIGKEVMQLAFELCKQEHRQEKAESWFWKTARTYPSGLRGQVRQYPHINKEALETILIANMRHLEGGHRIKTVTDVLSIFQKHGTEYVPKTVERLREVSSYIGIKKD
ncbi:MAG: hypothetical protein WAV30_00050 [Microgenomates group bacterium]